MIFSVEAVSYNMKTHDHMGKLSQVISLLLTEMKISSKCSGCRKALICWGSCDHPLCPPTKPGAVDLFWVIINHIMTWHYQYCHCLDIIVIGKVHQPVHLSKLPFIQILKILLLPPLMIIFVFIPHHDRYRSIWAASVTRPSSKIFSNLVEIQTEIFPNSLLNK